MSSSIPTDGLATSRATATPSAAPVVKTWMRLAAVGTFQRAQAAVVSNRFDKFLAELPARLKDEAQMPAVAEWFSYLRGRGIDCWALHGLQFQPGESKADDSLIGGVLGGNGDELVYFLLEGEKAKLYYLGPL